MSIGDCHVKQHEVDIGAVPNLDFKTMKMRSPLLLLSALRLKGKGTGM